MIRILLADDHEIMLDGYESILASQASIEVVGRAKNGKEVVTFLEHQTCNLILLDINMPKMDGVETARHIFQHRPSIKIIILSMLNDVSHIKTLVEMGVHGYLLKNCDKTTFITAINAVYRNNTYFDSAIKRIIDSNYKTQFAVDNEKVTLSEREIEIIRMVTLGLTTKQIAEEVYLSPHTVQTHRKNINFKLQTSSAVELAAFAREAGII